MSCKEFERHLAEWVAERLPEERALPMKAHGAACPACARAEAAERALRARWRDLPAPPEAPDLWPRLAARLSPPAPAPRRGARRAWAWGGALAALTLGLWAAHPLPRPRPAPVVDEARVVRLVAEMRRLPAPDADPLLRESGPPWPARRLPQTKNEVR